MAYSIDNIYVLSEREALVLEWLNYHHLLYFWTVARAGSISAACEELHVTQPTVSAQLRKLEDALGHELFERVGRRLVLTDTGRVVFRYADEIFSLGKDMMDTLKGRPAGSPLRFQVGIADVVPKLMALRLLSPAMNLPEQVRMICYEGKPTQLLAKLAVHDLDVVITESPATADTGVRAYSHALGECSVSFFATASEAARYRRGFPGSLDDAPMLLPTSNTLVRRALDLWLEAKGVKPNVRAEFEDSALLKVFGNQGVGVFPGPTAIAKEIQKQYGVKKVGEAETVTERFYAVSMERRVKHPAVAAIAKAAHSRIFTSS